MAALVSTNSVVSRLKASAAGAATPKVAAALAENSAASTLASTSAIARAMAKRTRRVASISRALLASHSASSLAHLASLSAFSASGVAVLAKTNEGATPKAGTAGEATPKAEAAKTTSATAPSTTPAAAKPAGGSVTTKTEKLQIAGEDFVPGSPLTDKQMRAVSMKKMMDKDNKYPYPAEVETQYAKQKPEFDTANKKMEAEALASGKKGFDEGAGVKPANKPSGSNAVDSFSKDVAQAKEGQGGTQVNSTNTVSQTNVQQRTTTAIKPPIRNNDSSLSKYNDSKYAF